MTAPVPGSRLITGGPLLGQPLDQWDRPVDSTRLVDPMASIVDAFATCCDVDPAAVLSLPTSVRRPRRGASQNWAPRGTRKPTGTAEWRRLPGKRALLLRWADGWLAALTLTSDDGGWDRNPTLSHRRLLLANLLATVRTGPSLLDLINPAYVESVTHDGLVAGLLRLWWEIEEEAGMSPATARMLVALHHAETLTGVLDDVIPAA